MEGPKLERWQELCALAATEDDPEKLLKLITEINRLLQEKEDRLVAMRRGLGTVPVRLASLPRTTNSHTEHLGKATSFSEKTGNVARNAPECSERSRRTESSLRGDGATVLANVPQSTPSSCRIKRFPQIQHMNFVLSEPHRCTRGGALTIS